MKPRYTHDCDRCLFLGQLGDRDWYYCAEQIGGGSVIGRYSSDGPDYWSMPLNMIKAYNGIESSSIIDAKQIVKENKL